MDPLRFLTGRRADGSLLWAAIDPSEHYCEARVADRRFGAYIAPFKDEATAREALAAGGAETIEAETRLGRRRELSIRG